MLLRIQKLRTLTHKGDTAKQNILLFHCRCNLRQIVRIADIICDFLHFTIHIIMR